ncbi:MAG TPA: DoxX family protein [Vicinamibacterales bacterium]
MTTLTQTWHGDGNDVARRSRGKSAFVWTLQVLSAAMFLFAGTHKLTGGEDMVQAFATIGIGQWFRYFTGILEIAGAIALLVPSLALYGATALILTMTGAVITHLFIIGGNPAPAAVLLLVNGIIAWTRGSRS